MTTYGTIPTSSAQGQPTNLEYVTRAKERIKADICTCRPWKLMFNLQSFGLPAGFADAIVRVRTNTGFFRMNYAIIVLLILFLSLLWHPISLIVFVVMMAVWLFLYFLRDEPLVVFGRTIDDRVVLIVLAVLTVVFLILTRATVNILVALLIGAVLVVLHAAMGKTDDLPLDEEATGLMTGVGPAGSAGSTSS
ncbi:PRA1 family protein F2-like [Alnus glutinosa]|uniref:PRA1 family protein F2-like n=1 Tax=Alnus glutinosa TaxID=3517 RepID=UPI002D79A53F|nr:PRA1 family protein F2-like [Alnus glutinosa]